MATPDGKTQILNKERIVFEIPSFDEFCELLHDRLHTILYHIEDIEDKFMLITNIFDRDTDRLTQSKKEGEVDLERLIYAGTERQRFILEKDKPQYLIKKLQEKGQLWDKKAWNKERTCNWAALHNRQIARGLLGVETFDFFDQYRRAEIDENYISVGSLKTYFSENLNVLKENERPIIEDYFDIEKDKYIGIPLLGMVLFQGIVWIIFPAASEKKFTAQKRIKRILKLFQLEYDNLAMSWQIRGRNIDRSSMFKRVTAEIKENNPIQEYIGIAKYYDINEHYHTERIKQSDLVLNRLRSQYLKTAIITILLDSFAHNISAHSLTTLSWWFRERAEYQNEEGKAIRDALGRDRNPIIIFNKLQESLREEDPKNMHTLARELSPLFKFLLEKGAFWSSITRRTNFTGKISSIYNILWYDFANNPLYLGTIANTEEVKKLLINLTIYEREDRPKGVRFKNKKIIKRSSNGRLLNGTFAIIDLQNFRLTPKDPQASVFVEKGGLFPELQAELSTYKAFFPGGVVGKHAFFTLLENEIRNVKHYRGAVLEDIQENGLVLNISIHERFIDSEAEALSAKPELYKIGVWLKHPVDISEDLLIKRIEGLDEDIVTEETFQPKLGGNFQDKICASFLMTSSFDRVQEKDSPIGKIYYPWIKTASYKIRNTENSYSEFEVSLRGYWEALGEKGTIQSNFFSEKGEGYLKKYFHIWKGADLLELDPNTDKALPELENPARFRFVKLPEAPIEQFRKFKTQGLIRIIASNLPDLPLEKAYQLWLSDWSKNQSEAYVIDFKEGRTSVGRITYQGAKINYENEDRIADVDLNDSLYADYKHIPNRMTIAITHGNCMSATADRFNYRSHGEFIRKFLGGKKLSLVEDIPKPLLYELFEALTTRICIFDRRIYNRLYTGKHDHKPDESLIHDEKRNLQLQRLQLYRNELHLNFQTERIRDFRKVQAESFLQYHFLVLHLSFIEGMEDPKGNKYGEDRIIEFIRDEILQGIVPEDVGNNFILIITTGRGRMAWWDKIKDRPEYARFTTFRPIEAIINAAEDALQKPDDIDLKYYLTKLFFGS